MSERILVTGATAPMGREVVRILREQGATVMAGTRRPDRALDVLGEDVDVVELDYRQAATFNEAVHWADHLLLQPPAFDPDAHETLKSLLDWAVQAGTRRVVLVSAMGMSVREDLPMRRLEHHVASLGVEYTILRPNFYMQSFAEGVLADRIRSQHHYQMPVDDARVTLVDARDVAAVAAAALVEAGHKGAEYTLTGPDALTHAEVAAVMTEASGSTIRYTACSDDEMLGWLTGSGWRPDVAGVVISMYQAVRGGVRAEATDDLERLLGRPARSFSDFADEHGESWA
ncbi:MAG: NmrA family NAD(P)-binding protein [Gemmatimonadota bacterium]